MPDFILLYIFMWFLPMQINLSPGVGHIVSYTQSPSTSGVCFTEFHLEIIKVFQWDKTNVVYWDILYKIIHKKKIHGVENWRCYLVLVKKISVIWNESFFCGNLYISLGLTASTTALTGCTVCIWVYQLKNWF